MALFEFKILSQQTQQNRGWTESLGMHSLIDRKRTTYVDGLSDKEMYHHLHIANVYHGIHHYKSIDVCVMISHIVRQDITKWRGKE